MDADALKVLRLIVDVGAAEAVPVAESRIGDLTGLDANRVSAALAALKSGALAVRVMPALTASGSPIRTADEPAWEALTKGRQLIHPGGDG